MVNPDHQSPNAIPPRTSSTGVIPPAANPGPSAAAKPVLRPVSEASWISPPAHRRMSSTTSASAANATLMQAPSTQRGPPPSNTTPANAALGAAGVGDGSNGSNGRQTKGSLSAGFPEGDGSRWSAEQERIVLGPFDYMQQQPGKDIRRQLIMGFNRWLEVPEERLAVIAKVITMLHNASLLVDDVEDSSLLRRGGPVAHNVFGVAQTLNSGNYVYFLALRELLRLDNPRLVDIYTHELCNLHRGQGMDLYWRDTLTCPTEADYLEMVGNKTGGLFRLTIKLMQAESATGKDCSPLVNLMGLIFQIRDDYMNLRSTDYTQNKGLCEDLTEGKFSFPIIHSIRSNPLNLQLVNILRQKTADEAVKRYAVEYMERTGSFEYTQAVVREMMERARGLVADIDGGAGRGDGVLAILDKLSI